MFNLKHPCRRSFLRAGGLTTLALGIQQLTPGKLAAEEGTDGVAVAQAGRKAKSCIFIWLDGGPSHLETFDLKPAAPVEVRGPFQPVKTQVAGVHICELMPRTAAQMKHIALVRSVTSRLGEHNLGANYMLTGYQPTPALQYPSFGAVNAHLRGRRAAGKQQSVLPGFIATPTFRVGGGNFDGRGYLPAATAPFVTGGDPAKAEFRVRDLDFFPGLDDQRLSRRKRFLDSMERMREKNPTAVAGAAFEEAFQLATSASAREAFDLSKEKAATRQRYGPKTIGQSCLLARRLVERGAPFVFVNNPGWDTHQGAYTRLKEGFTGARNPVGLIPSLDLAFGALVEDLQQRGLLEQTLVVVMGEFGRTPKVNTTGGRDHWPRVYSVALAGGGVTGGNIIGASDAAGESPRDQPVTPADLAATIYKQLGIDPRHTLQTPGGRPVQINRDGTPFDV